MNPIKETPASIALDATAILGAINAGDWHAVNGVIDDCEDLPALVRGIGYMLVFVLTDDHENGQGAPVSYRIRKVTEAVNAMIVRQS